MASSFASSSGAGKWYDDPKYQKVPAEALNVSSKAKLSRFLNPLKTVMSNAVYIPDWRGLAEVLDFEMQDIEYFGLSNDPTAEVIKEWIAKGSATLGRLFEVIDNDLSRLDIVEDAHVQKLIERDVERYKRKQEEKLLAIGQPIQDPEVTPSVPHINENPDRFKVDEMEVDQFSGITVGEVRDNKVEYFDAYISYTLQNHSFVNEMIKILEDKNGNFGLKLCVDARDLIPGTSYHVVTAKLIEERCKRVIIVLSPDYLKSAECDFQCKFAHSLSPGSRSKKIIPVLVGQISSVPNILRHITICDYTKTDLQEWFWERLGASLMAPLKLSDADKAKNKYEEMKSISYNHDSPINSVRSSGPPSVSSVQIDSLPPSTQHSSTNTSIPASAMDVCQASDSDSSPAAPAVQHKSKKLKMPRLFQKKVRSPRASPVTTSVSDHDSDFEMLAADNPTESAV